MKYVLGSGFLSPTRNSKGVLNTGDYEVDPLTNSVIVSGCKGSMTSKPSGSLTFHYIKLPDYIQDSDYFKINIFSDSKRAMPIISSSDQLRLEKK